MIGKTLRGLVAGAVVALLATAGTARASFMVTITEVDTGQTVTIIDDNLPPGTGLDTNVSAGEISYSTPVVGNPFTDFDVVGLAATSNRTTNGTVGNITISGNVFRNTNTAGARTLRIDVTDNGFTGPATGPVELNNSGGVTFTNASSPDTHTFTSYEGTLMNQLTNPTTTLTNVSTRSGNPSAPESFGDDSPPLPIAGFVSPYSLTNRTTITLGPSITGATVSLRRAEIGGSTTLIAAAVPEPASMALLGLGGLGVLGLFGRRKAKATA